MESITDFYFNSVILITGGNGFLGKVIIEKLLRSCPEVRKIYFVIRAKGGKTVDERLKEFYSCEAFERVQNEIHKLIPIVGDLVESNLGFSEKDLETVKNEVQIVYHVAANVKFNEELKTAAHTNTLGTKHVLELCGLMRKLKSVVYVSTAFINPQFQFVEEKVYSMNNIMPKDVFLNVNKYLPADLVQYIFDQIQIHGHNSYTLTKAMAESVVEDYQTRFPLSIVRPVIVVNAVSEPYPGWVEGMQSATRALCEIYRGTLRVVYTDPMGICSFIPVDILTNTIIAAAWSNGKNFAERKSLTVYNCTPYQMNPITFKEQLNLYLKWSRIYPPLGAIQYPNAVYSTNRIFNWWISLTRQKSLAMLADIKLLMRGKKPFFMKLTKRRIAKLSETELFIGKSWTFSTNNYEKLIAEVALASDGSEFNCDIGTLNWDLYFKDAVLGQRKYILKEDEDNLEKAQKRLRRLFWMEKIIIGMFFTVLMLGFCTVTFLLFGYKVVK